MVRSTAISWKIGLAVAALALPLGQLPALADEGLSEGGLSETGETRPQPLEPKVVPVILLPPASDDVFASQRPALLDEAPIVMVRPARKDAIAQPFSEPAETQQDATAEESPAVPEEPLRAEIQVDATVEERPSAQQWPTRIASLPPVSDAAIASPPPEPEKTPKSATPVVIPALPGRSPFRQVPFKSEIVEIEPKDAAILQQQASEPAPAKGNAATRFLANLWPGNKSTAEGGSSSGGKGEADSLVPPTASASASIEQAEADPKSEKPPAARFLDGIQFWKD